MSGTLSEQCDDLESTRLHNTTGTTLLLLNAAHITNQTGPTFHDHRPPFRNITELHEEEYLPCLSVWQVTMVLRINQAPLGPVPVSETGRGVHAQQQHCHLPQRREPHGHECHQEIGSTPDFTRLKKLNASSTL